MNSGCVFLIICFLFSLGFCQVVGEIIQYKFSGDLQFFCYFNFMFANYMHIVHNCKVCKFEYNI